MHHPHQVFFLHHAVLADKLAGHAAVLRQHQQADGVDVQAAGRHQAFKLAAVEEEAGVVFAPAILRLNQGDGGLVAILGLAADDAHRFVDQNCHQVGLRTLGRFADLNAVVFGDLHASFGDLAVDLHPALGNPFVGLAARGQGQIRHAFIQAYGAAQGLGCRRRGTYVTGAANRPANHLGGRQLRPGGRPCRWLGRC